MHTEAKNYILVCFTIIAAIPVLFFAVYGVCRLADDLREFFKSHRK